MKTGSYNDFWQTLHGIARSGRNPLRVMFELTYACNFHCKHCYVPARYRGTETLSTAQVFDVIRQLMMPEKSESKSIGFKVDPN